MALPYSEFAAPVSAEKDGRRRSTLRQPEGIDGIEPSLTRTFRQPRPAPWAAIDQHVGCAAIVNDEPVFIKDLVIDDDASKE